MESTQRPVEQIFSATRSLLFASLALSIVAVATGCASLGERPVRGEAKGKVVCEVSGFGYFDPIVYPGVESPIGHEHTFVGSRAILRPSQRDDADARTLRGASTSCSNRDDTAAYWFPTIAVDGKPLEITNVTGYYYSGSAYRPRLAVPTEPFPPGLRVITGRRDGSGTQHVFWSCGDNTDRNKKYATPAEARCDLASPEPGVPENHVGLRLKFRFPDCWDGLLTDHSATGTSTADHADDGSVANHLAYSEPDGGCPDSYPRKLPMLSLHVHFDYSGDGSGITVASGDFSTLHADFWNTWIQTKKHPDAVGGGLARFNATCVTNGGGSQTRSRGDSRRLGGERNGRPALGPVRLCGARG